MKPVTYQGHCVCCLHGFRSLHTQISCLYFCLQQSLLLCKSERTILLLTFLLLFRMCFLAPPFCCRVGICTAVALFVSSVMFWKHHKAISLYKQHIQALKSRLFAAMDQQVRPSLHFLCHTFASNKHYQCFKQHLHVKQPLHTLSTLSTASNETWYGICQPKGTEGLTSVKLHER